MLTRQKGKQWASFGKNKGKRVRGTTPDTVLSSCIIGYRVTCSNSSVFSYIVVYAVTVFNHHLIVQCP